MKHPFQLLVSNKDGSVVFTATKNTIQAFDLKQSKRIGVWTDEVDVTSSIKEKVVKEQQRQIAENASKKSKTNEGEAKPVKEAKVPTPGPGAPQQLTFIRALHLTRDEQHLICTTDTDKAGVVFKLNYDAENVLEVVKRQPFPKRPCGIESSIDGKDMVIADKFGDVYSVDMEGASISISDETGPILGHVSMLTDIAMTEHNGKQFIFTADRDEHIRISHYPKAFVINKWLFGHEEFVASLCLPKWNSDLLFSAGGDNYMCAWDWTKPENNLLEKFDIRSLVTLDDDHLAPERFQNEEQNLREMTVSQIVTFDELQVLCVLVEATNTLIFVKYSEGTMTLMSKLELPNKIVSIVAISGNRIIASLESEENKLLQFIKYDNGDFVVDESMDTVISAISALQEIEADSKSDFYPLFPTMQLRKRGEH